MSNAPSNTVSLRISIDVSLDNAAETLSRLQPVIERLSSQATGNSAPFQSNIYNDSTDQNSRKKAEVRNHFENQKKLFQKKTVQAYRTFRRISGRFEKAYDAHKEIGAKIGWPAAVVGNVISVRRREIKRYLRKRYKQTILRLLHAGWTNKEISRHLKLSTSNVVRLAKEVREENRPLLKGASNA